MIPFSPIISLTVSFYQNKKSAASALFLEPKTQQKQHSAGCFSLPSFLYWEVLEPVNRLSCDLSLT